MHWSWLFCLVCILENVAKRRACKRRWHRCMSTVSLKSAKNKFAHRQCWCCLKNRLCSLLLSTTVSNCGPQRRACKPHCRQRKQLQNLVDKNWQYRTCKRNHTHYLTPRRIQLRCISCTRREGCFPCHLQINWKQIPFLQILLHRGSMHGQAISTVLLSTPRIRQRDGGTAHDWQGSIVQCSWKGGGGGGGYLA